MIVKDTLLEADTFFGKFELEGAVCYPSNERTCCISCKTDDDLAYLYIENFDKKSDAGENVLVGDDNYGYTEKEFAIRRWYPLHAMLNMCSAEKLNLKLEDDEFGYPNKAIFKYDNVKMVHYLQNYSFISNQDDLLNLYKQKRFELRQASRLAEEHIDLEVVKTLSRFSTMLNEKYFRIGTNEEGKSVLYFGDMNQSIDCASVTLPDEIGINANWNESSYFGIDYFTMLYRSIGSSDNIKIKFTPSKIIMMTKDEHYLKVGILVGKNM